MILTDKAKQAIKASIRTKNLLALAMNCSVMTITRWLKDPKNDDLTKAAALQVIREQTGFQDCEILEAEEAVAK